MSDPAATVAAGWLTVFARRTALYAVALIAALAGIGITLGLQQSTISDLEAQSAALNHQAAVDAQASKPLVRIIVREGATIAALRVDLRQVNDICRAVHCERKRHA